MGYEIKLTDVGNYKILHQKYCPIKIKIFLNILWSAKITTEQKHFHMKIFLLQVHSEENCPSNAFAVCLSNFYNETFMMDVSSALNLYLVKQANCILRNKQSCILQNEKKL